MILPQKINKIRIKLLTIRKIRSNINLQEAQGEKPQRAYIPINNIPQRGCKTKSETGLDAGKKKGTGADPGTTFGKGKCERSFHFPCRDGGKKPGSADCQTVGIRTWRTLDEVL